MIGRWNLYDGALDKPQVVCGTAHDMARAHACIAGVLRWDGFVLALRFGVRGSLQINGRSGNIIGSDAHLPRHANTAKLRSREL